MKDEGLESLLSILPDNSKHYGYLIEYPVLKRKEDLL